MKGKNWKAGFTIEAAVVVPIAMVLMVAVILVAFVLHDGVILRTVPLFEMMDHAKDLEEEPEKIAALAREELFTRVIAAKETKVSVQEGKKEIQAEANGSFFLPGGLFRSVTGMGFDRAEAKIVVSNLDGRGALIQYKTICDGLATFGSKENEAGE